MTIIPPDEDRDQRLTVDELARLGDTEFFGVLNRTWEEEAEAAEEAGEADALYGDHLLVGGLNRLHAGQVRTEDGLRQLQGVVRRTQDAVAGELREVAAAQAATDAEVNRLRAFLQSYDGPLSWLVDGACVAIIVGASILYLKWMDVDLTLGNLGLVIMADIVLICIALAFTSHIRRLPDPPAPAPQGGNGAGQPQQQNPPRQRRFGRRAQPAPAAPAAPAAATQQLPVVLLPPPPPPPPAAPPQANP